MPMTSARFMKSFEIRGFRAINRLEIPELARVNLFVGKNNAGKSSLLEAIRLYLHRHSNSIAAVIYEILREHTDHRPSSFAKRGAEFDAEELQSALDALESLFHGSFASESFPPILLRQAEDDSDSLQIRLDWTAAARYASEGITQTRPALIDPLSTVLELESGAETTLFPLDWFIRRIPVPRSATRNPAVMIGSSGLTPAQTRQMWDRVSLTGQESLVEEALRTVVPELERILLIGESGHRSILLKLSSVAKPIPMQGMGDGVNRIFGIAVALILAQGGALLIDEIENGLHYSTHEEVWTAIFGLAAAFDVQVFATTHSWDAVLGFQHAATRSDEAGILYRLERGAGGDVTPIAFTEEEVAIAARHEVEIR
jgi:hypothetical protein